MTSATDAVDTRAGHLIPHARPHLHADVRRDLIAGARRGAHVVQFYEEDSFLVETVSQYVAAGLGTGDPTVVIATRAHRESLLARLAASSFDTDRARNTGQLTLLDAEETLALLMDGELPDANKFASVVGTLMRSVRAKNHDRSARAYGEMVDLLWRNGNPRAAIRLEELWTDLAQVEAFSLVCGYNMDNFRGTDDAGGFQSVCGGHTHVFPTEAFSSLPMGEERLREVSVLQQRARALEAEVVRRTELESSLREREEELRGYIARLKAAEERFHRMHQAAPDGLGIFRPLRRSDGQIVDFVYTYLNPVTAKQLGLPPEEILGRTLLEMLPGLDQTPFWKAFCRVADTGQSDSYEAPYSEHGWQGWFRNTVVSLGDEIAVTYSDISDRRRAEESIRFLAEASSILAGSLDYDTTLASVARLAVPTIADWATVDMLMPDGRLRRLAVAHVDPRKVELAHDVERRFPTDMDAQAGIANVLRTGKAELVPEITDAHLVASIKDAELLGIIRALGLRSTICVPLRSTGRVVGAMTLFSAESNRRYTEEDLRLAEDIARRASMAIENAVLYRAAEEANRSKDDFLAMVSHDLRAPLNAIVGWVQMLRAGGLSDARRAHALEVVERNARAQSQLIEDLLDVSRIVSGKLRVDAQPVDLGVVVEAAIETVRPAATGKGVALLHDVEPGTASVMGDPERLQQVVWNLLANAVKFSSRGMSVRVTVRRVAELVEVVVRDEGQGIEAGFLPYVFERFRQADTSASRPTGGLGLGLAIVRNLVELHGGTVTAASDGIGRGATFTVSLPISSARSLSFSRPPALQFASAADSLECPPELEGVHVLVVDDEDDARDILSALLARCRVTVSLAASAAEAIRRVREDRPDVVISDIGMPGEDGYAFIKRLRAVEPAQGGRTPAVALTACARVEERTKALVSGFNTHVPKPVDPAELMAVLVSLTSTLRPG
jgi:signal transduction histidine kinase/CheY-like chemotaxis protein